MPTYRRPIAATAVCIFALVGSQAAGQKPPDTKRGATVDTLHGVAIANPYRWLEDQQAPDTRAWIVAENQFTDAVLKPLPGHERIEKRLTELTQIETVGTPTAAGGRYFYTKRSPDQELAVLFVREGAAGASQVLVDPHPLSADHSVSVSLMDVAADGRVVAYGERNGGQDEVAVKLLQVDGRKVIDELPRGRYSGVNITPAKTDVYYSRQTKEGPRVFHHVVGQPSARDVEIFGQGFGPEKIIQVDLSGDGRYLLVDVLHGAAAVKSEIYVQDLRAATGLQPIVNDVDALFEPTIGGDTLYLRTNWKAPNGRVLAVDLQHPSRDKWREIIKEQKAPIAAVAAAGGRLVVSSFLGVQTHIQIYSVDGVQQREVAFPTLGSTGGLSGRWDSDELFFNFSSWALPNTIYRYAIATGARTEWARVKVPIDSSAFEVKQVWYPSKDGTQIPMFVGAKKGLALDGTQPTFLTGYGGFNLSMTPGFSALACLLDGERWRLRAAEPARRRRVRRGVAPGRDAARRSRTCSTISPRPRSGSSPTSTRRAPSSAIQAARTAACSWARCSPQHPELVRRGRLLRSAARHAALSAVPRGRLLGAGVRIVRRTGAVRVPYARTRRITT